MIWPWSFEWKGWSAFSITWALMGLNVFMFVLVQDLSPHDVKQESLSVDHIYLTAQLYNQYKNGISELKKSEIPDSISKAMQDPDFIRLAPLLEFRGDPVAIEDWKKAWGQYHQHLQQRSMKTFGFSEDRHSFFNAITYQFVHASFLHLLSNITLLFLFGSVIELALGGFALLMIYLSGGILGAIFYLVVAEPTVAPMVGASVSVSALIGFYFFAEAKTHIRFMYFFSPIPGYFGEIWLRKWCLLPVFMLSDMTMLLRGNNGLSSVAHWGHLGGLIFGLLLGGTLVITSRIFQKFREQSFILKLHQ